MKFRIGFISNSSASSFLVTDKSLALETVKKRIAEVVGYHFTMCSFSIIDKQFMSNPNKNHHDLPFLRPKLSKLYDKYTKKRPSTNAVKIKYYKKKKDIIDKYIKTDEFRKKYEGTIYVYIPQLCCFDDELNAKLGDIGHSVRVSDSKFGWMDPDWDEDNVKVHWKNPEKLEGK